MGRDSKIEWTDHTWNPWWGCARVSPGCEHCYAETFSKRVGLKVWGVNTERRFFGQKHWAEPLKWDAAAEREGVRRRVFCASMADVFEDRPDLEEQRAKLWNLVEFTQHLDWLLLTKRPENMVRLAPKRWAKAWPCNVWAGCTVEDQKRAEERIYHLYTVPAVVRFLSCEPLLGLVDLTHIFDEEWVIDAMRGARWHCSDGPNNAVEWPSIDWVIVGSESGPGARPMAVDWASSIVDQCKTAAVPVFIKQIANASDRKGGNPVFWPAGDWPRQWPEARR